MSEQDKLLSGLLGTVEESCEKDNMKTRSNTTDGKGKRKEKTVKNCSGQQLTQVSKKSGSGDVVATSHSDNTPESTISKGGNKTDNDMIGFANIMKDCFKQMTDNIERLGDKLADKIDMSIHSNYEYDGYDEEIDDCDDTQECQDNVINKNEPLFSHIKKDYLLDEKTGPKIDPQLADLVNNMMSMKPNEEAIKQRIDKHPRPENCGFLETPKVNEQIWTAISPATKSLDATLQNIEKNFLKGVNPLTKVVEDLLKVREKIKPEILDVSEMVKNITDSIAFIGIANVDLIKKRRELVKQDLPHKMHKLCGSSVEFTGSLLFGEKLAQDMKDINEANKLTTELMLPYGNKHYSDRESRMRYSGRPRGGAVNFRSFRDRGRVRFNPYNRGACPPARGLNYQRPSQAKRRDTRGK